MASENWFSKLELTGQLCLDRGRLMVLILLGTLILVNVDADRTEIVIGVPDEIWGFNPENGKLRSYCEALGTRSFCSTVVTAGRLISALGDQRSGSIAIKPGGEKDIKKTRFAWTGRDYNRIGTPGLVDNQVHFVSNRVATCVDAQRGSCIYQGRLAGGSTANEPCDAAATNWRSCHWGPGGGQDDSSPVAADGKLYSLARNGETHVPKAGDQFELLATNRVSERRRTLASPPPIIEGIIIIRSCKHLYCIAETNAK